jgi:UDP-glucose 4-epimerase
MNIVITGGNGFIGSHLLQVLAARGEALTVIDRGAPRPDVDWTGIRYLQGSFDDADVLEEALRGADLVYHLASTTVPGTADLDPVGDVRGNLLGTMALVQAMQQAGCRRLVYLSSGGTVYGDPDVERVDERAPTRPISSYGIVKLAIERFLLMYERGGTLEPVILRASNPYGARQGKLGLQGLVSTAIDRIGSQRTLQVWGDGSAVRDYIYIDDLIDLMEKAAFSSRTGVYNAGSGQGASVLEIIGAVSSALGIEAVVEYAPSRPFDVARIVLDISRATSEFVWYPSTSLVAGINSTVQAWRSS